MHSGGAHFGDSVPSVRRRCGCFSPWRGAEAFLRFSAVEERVIYFRWRDVENPVRPTQGAADLQKRRGRGVLPILKISKSRDRDATSCGQCLK